MKKISLAVEFSHSLAPLGAFGQRRSWTDVPGGAAMVLDAIAHQTFTRRIRYKIGREILLGTVAHQTVSKRLSDIYGLHDTSSCAHFILRTFHPTHISCHRQFMSQTVHLMNISCDEHFMPWTFHLFQANFITHILSDFYREFYACAAPETKHNF